MIYMWFVVLTELLHLFINPFIQPQTMYPSKVFSANSVQVLCWVLEIQRSMQGVVEAYRKGTGVGYLVLHKKTIPKGTLKVSIYYPECL